MNDIETVIDEEFGTVLSDTGDIPVQLLININSVEFLDENGCKIVHPVDDDVEKKIINKHILDEFGDKYIKYQANFDKIENSYLVYDISLIAFRP